MTRPRKFTDRQIVEALKQSKGLIYVAARALGCEVKVIYRRRKKSAMVAKAIKEERGHFVDVAEAVLQKSVLSAEPWAVALVLKTLGKNRGYVERQEMTGKGGQPVQLEVVETVVYTRAEAKNILSTDSGSTRISGRNGEG
jgi:hypothetical protein